MRFIEKWLSKHRYKQEKFVSLYDMMFDAKEFPYLSFRLSLFNLQLIFHFFAHVILFYFMEHKLASRTFTTLIFINGLKSLIDSGWWGGLEVLRSQVRNAYHTGNKEEMNRAISFWITLSLFISIPFLAIAAYFSYEAYWKYIYQEPMFKPLFIILVCVSVAVHIPLGAFHSGIYGISRVMRPRFSMILSYLAGLCVLFATWSEFKIYAILLSILTEIVVSSALTWYYTLHMYDLYNIVLEKLDHHDFRRRLSELPIYHFILGFVANVFIMIDSILIIVFYFLAFEHTQLILLIKIIYLISPLICASSDWARLFYFDRKQLENDQLSIFINQYDKSISRTASFLGFCFGITAILASYLLISPTAAGYTAIMLPFFLMRSLIADRQVRAFTYNRYYDVIVTGILMVLAWVGIYNLKYSLLTKGFCVAVAMIIIHAFLKRYRFPSYGHIKYQSLYTNLYHWLSALKNKKEIVEIYKLQLDHYIQAQQRIGLLRRMREQLGLAGDHVCLNGDHPLLFYRNVTDSTTELTPIDFANISQGLIRKVEHCYVGEVQNPEIFNAPIYRLEACPLLQDLIEKPLKHALEDPNFPQYYQEVIYNFIEQFPNGIYYDPERHLGPTATPLPYNIVRKFTMLIWQYLFKQRGSSRADTDLTLLFNKGLVHVIFVIPRDPNSEEETKKIREWHLLIHAVNISHSLIPETSELAILNKNWYSQQEKGIEFA